MSMLPVSGLPSPFYGSATAGLNSPLVAASSETITNADVVEILNTFGTDQDLSPYRDVLPRLLDHGLVEEIESSRIAALRLEIELARKASAALPLILELRRQEAESLIQLQEVRESFATKLVDSQRSFFRSKTSVSQKKDELSAQDARVAQVQENIKALGAAEEIIAAQLQSVAKKQIIIDTAKLSGDSYWRITSQGEKMLLELRASGDLSKPFGQAEEAPAVLPPHIETADPNASSTLIADPKNIGPTIPTEAQIALRESHPGQNGAHLNLPEVEEIRSEEHRNGLMEIIRLNHGRLAGENFDSWTGKIVTHLLESGETDEVKAFFNDVQKALSPAAQKVNCTVIFNELSSNDIDDAIAFLRACLSAMDNADEFATEVIIPAVDAALAGKNFANATTLAVGCKDNLSEGGSDLVVGKIVAAALEADKLETAKSIVSDLAYKFSSSALAEVVLDVAKYALSIDTDDAIAFCKEYEDALGADFGSMIAALAEKAREDEHRGDIQEIVNEFSAIIPDPALSSLVTYVIEKGDLSEGEEIVLAARDGLETARLSAHAKAIALKGYADEDMDHALEYLEKWDANGHPKAVAGAAEALLQRSIYDRMPTDAKAVLDKFSAHLDRSAVDSYVVKTIALIAGSLDDFDIDEAHELLNNNGAKMEKSALIAAASNLLAMKTKENADEGIELFNKLDDDNVFGDHMAAVLVATIEGSIAQQDSEGAQTLLFKLKGKLTSDQRKLLAEKAYA